MNETIRSLIHDKLLDDAGRSRLATLSDEDSLLRSGLFDSLSLVEMMGTLEQHFDVTFDPFDVTIENLETIGRIASLVAGKLQGRAER